MIPTLNRLMRWCAIITKVSSTASTPALWAMWMRWYANELGYGAEADFWQTVGILHDLDFEQWPEQHCTKEQELMREKALMSASSTQRPATAGT